MERGGEQVPYFLVSKEGLPLDGSTPTLLYGCRRPRGPPLAARAPRALLLDRYGGFEISLTPSYSAGIGAAWLEKGHAYVQANIRGGGEYGPRWHQAALKEKRSKAYEDFEAASRDPTSRPRGLRAAPLHARSCEQAVARDLISRGVTSPAKLGCQGGSNGGLLTGNMLARPTAGSTLFGAIVCQVPPLEMQLAVLAPPPHLA